MNMFIDLGIVFLLLLLNGFFAMSELALVSARKARLQQMVEGKNRKGAKLALILAEDPSSFLSIVQIGVTLNSILAGAFSGATLSQPLGIILNENAFLAPYGEKIAFFLIVTAVSFLSLVVGELVPKRIGLAYAEIIAVHVAWLMRFLAFFAAPVVWVLKISSNFILKIMCLGEAQAADFTEEEIRYLVAEGTQSGVFMPAEKNMIEGVMRLGDRNVRTLMTPRIDIVWLGVEDDYQENKRIILESNHSLLPLARGDMDEVLGAVHAKDVLGALFRGEAFDLQALARETLVVPDTTPVLRLLDQFKKSGQHMAIVIDEYGSVEGLVTLTDVLEAIIGDLPELGDESDEEPVQREDGSWLFDGMTPIDEVEATLGLRDLREGDEFHTIAGFIIDKLGRLPIIGDHFYWNESLFEVIEMDSRRIHKVLIHPSKNTDEGDKEID